jgi:hypothetical protein
MFKNHKEYAKVYQVKQVLTAIDRMEMDDGTTA